MAKQEGTPVLHSHLHVPNTTAAAFEGEKKFQEIFEHANKTPRRICPVRDVIERVSDKWSILVIYALGGYGTLRFNELKHKIEDISQRMLTVTVRNLERDGFITRKMYPEIPPRVEYSLTPLGYSLMGQFALFAQWANDHGEEILKSRKRSLKAAVRDA